MFGVNIPDVAIANLLASVLIQFEGTKIDSGEKNSRAGPCSDGCRLSYRVNDEKDARGYLQALATKMTEDLETMKASGTSSAVGICSKRRVRNIF